MIWFTIFMIIRGHILIVNLKIKNIVNNKDEKSAAMIIMLRFGVLLEIKTLHKALVIRGPVLGGESSTDEDEDNPADEFGFALIVIPK